MLVARGIVETLKLTRGLKRISVFYCSGGFLPIKRASQITSGMSHCSACTQSYHKGNAE
jgi:hypothetical protein